MGPAGALSLRPQAGDAEYDEKQAQLKAVAEHAASVRTPRKAEGEAEAARPEARAPEAEADPSRAGSGRKPPSFAARSCHHGGAQGRRAKSSKRSSPREAPLRCPLCGRAVGEEGAAARTRTLVVLSA